VEPNDKLASFLEHPSSAGLFLDFDGTLSEIVHIPSEARPVDGAPEVLQALTRRFAVVAVVSGRSAGQLLEWLGPDIEIWGVHGAERTESGRVVLSRRAERYSGLMSKVRAEAEERLRELDLPGVILEDKGVMIGLHFRAAEDPQRAARVLDELARDLADEHGLLRAGGRLAYELRPPEEFSKRSVVLDRARAENLNAAAFLGDDKVDLPGFDALDLLDEEGAVTMRVAVDSDEAPPVLLERADLVVAGPPGALAFLRSLL
jgi:trehalose 6-phosphate phosphatase